jgi:hypothetical protein
MVILYSHKLNCLQMLKIRFIVLEQPFNKLSFISRKRSSFSISNTITQNQIIFSGVLGLSGTNAPIWMNGFRFIAPNSNIKIDLKINAQYLPGTNIRVTISTTVLETLAVDYVYYSVAVYIEN